MKKLNLNGFSTMELILVLVVVSLVGFAGFKVYESKNLSPKNLVWVADETIEAPKDLVKYLKNRDDCNDYKGTNSVKGVTLSAIYQVVQDKYAKIALGCSTNLDRGFPIIKVNSQWTLLQAGEYYVVDISTSETESIVRCSVVDKYQISKDFEPSCVEDNDLKLGTVKNPTIREVTYP